MSNPQFPRLAKDWKLISEDDSFAVINIPELQILLDAYWALQDGMRVHATNSEGDEAFVPHDEEECPKNATLVLDKEKK